MGTINMQSGASLESWLARATCGLAAASAAQVRREIEAHYESACEAAMVRGARPEEAQRAAMASMGDAKTANRQYRKVLLTRSEVRLLRETRWEQAVICSRSQWLLPVIAAGLCACGWFLFSGRTQLSVTLLVGLLGIAFVFAAPSLPIYTPARGRVVRGLRWTWLATMLVLVSWPYVWVTLAWPLVWVEWRLFSLRRKLPVAEWPKQLYL